MRSYFFFVRSCRERESEKEKERIRKKEEKINCDGLCTFVLTVVDEQGSFIVQSVLEHIHRCCMLKELNFGGFGRPYAIPVVDDSVCKEYFNFLL